MLYLFGTACIPVFCFFVLKAKKLEKEHEEKEEKEREEKEAEADEAKERRYDQIVATFVMCMAWSSFYGTKWALGMAPGWSDNRTLLAVVEAVVCSLVCFSLIFI